MLKLFSLPNCPRCDLVKEYLTSKNIPFEYYNMETAEAITELRVIGCFAMEAPVLVNSDDVFIESNTMFPDGKIESQVIDFLVSA